jgi:hypothetical protein
METHVIDLFETLASSSSMIFGCDHVKILMAPFFVLKIFIFDQNAPIMASFKFEPWRQII